MKSISCRIYWVSTLKKKQVFAMYMVQVYSQGDGLTVFPVPCHLVSNPSLLQTMYEMHSVSQKLYRKKDLSRHIFISIATLWSFVQNFFFSLLMEISHKLWRSPWSSLWRLKEPLCSILLNFENRLFSVHCVFKCSVRKIGGPALKSTISWPLKLSVGRGNTGTVIKGLLFSKIQSSVGKTAKRTL